MNRDVAVLAVLGVLALGVCVVLSPWSPLVQKAAPEGQEGVTWSPNIVRAHVTRGGLYHPPVCGEGRTGLIEHGWDWISSPPSEVTGAGWTDN
jgi:hypothetical protein